MFDPSKRKGASMKLQGAVIKEQGITFAVVIVKKSVIDDRTKADQAILSFTPVFPGLPVVLMAQNSSGRPTYYGRPDLSKFLANIPMAAIPWKEYEIH
jgi:hypothetical protein